MAGILTPRADPLLSTGSFRWVLARAGARGAFGASLHDGAEGLLPWHVMRPI